MRKTCRQLRGYVEDYIQIGNTITCLLHNMNKKISISKQNRHCVSIILGLMVFITGGGDVDRKQAVETSEIMFVFKRHGKISSTYTHVLPGFPGRRVPRLEGFGGISDGRIIVGYGRNIFEYKIKERRWTNQFINVHCQIDFELGVGIDTHLVGCALNEDQLLLCWDTQVQLFQCKKNVSENDVPIKSSRVPSSTVGRQRSARPSNTQNLISTVCLTQLPVSANGDSLTRVDHNKVMFVGSYWVFEGELSENKNDVIWRKLEFPKIPRRHHIAFKFGDSLYIAGGFEQQGNDFAELSSCERYDFKENKWFDCPHTLPHPLVCASVVVSNDETFAVIIGGYYRHDFGAHHESSQIITFTETEGFQLLEENILSWPRSSCHTSIRIQ